MELYVKGFEPSFLDKLFDNDPRSPAAAVLRRLSVDELKDTVARDIEALLNARIVFHEEDLKAFPECKRSILTYGMNDFAGLSLASHSDRVFICRSLELAIARHEPRLKNVYVNLEVDKNSINVLHFSIRALLVVDEAREPINFDALLQPSTLQYAVSKSRVSSALE
jgi:type VI secretion system protein ImpF